MTEPGKRVLRAALSGFTTGLLFCLTFGLILAALEGHR
jgi:hypothetical protein